MHIVAPRPLFDWEALEDCPTLASVTELLASIPDGALLEGRRIHRGRGRNDYPVTVLWGVVMVVHLAFAAQLAAAPRREGALGKMRLSPIAQRLRQAMRN